MAQEKFKVFRRRFSWHNSYPREHWLMTPEELLERVREDSRGDYGWITSATELVRTCKSPGFPDEVAEEITDLILNCFANIGSVGSDKGDRIAVFYCLEKTHNTQLKTRFLRRVIKGMMRQNFGDEVTEMFYYDKETEGNFIQRKLTEFCQIEKSGLTYAKYASWVKRITEDYDRELTYAEEDGKLPNKGIFRPLKIV